MADAFISTNAASLGTSLVQAAYDKKVEGPLRHMTVLRRIADKHPADLTNPGSSVVLQKYADIVAGDRKITETVDPDAVGLPSTSSVTIAYEEYGVPALQTKRLRHVSLTQTDPIIVDALARDMAVTLDTDAGVKLYAGTNVTYAGDATSTVTVDGTDLITAAKVRRIIVGLRNRAVHPRVIDRHGEFFVFFTHPNVALDLREQTGAGGWRDSHVYTAPDVFWTGETGRFEGAIFVESSRMKTATDGAASETVYRSLVVGAQALAEAVWEEPHSIVNQGVFVDKLNRFMTYGWYGALNWGVYRQEALERFESASSLT